ncbi:glycosyltransferase [Pseudomonas sp.]|uniref:glycosyltransferase n=1 Tax=Pseudomonas sp. TaxID=306 RepID=UPI0019FFE794|nr:glycosyltransferase [Pseudomonas sp.]MBF0676100.1 glycosyltransferase [Pseudomonas sp.]
MTRVLNAVFIRSSARPIPRIIRMIHVAQELNVNCRFVGAHRDKGLPKVDLWSGINVCRVGRYFPLANGTGFLTYLKGVTVFNYSCFRLLIKTKPDLVHVSDYDSYLGGWLYSRFYGVKLIYNIHDNLSQRYPVNFIFKGVLNFIEGMFVLGSNISLVPEDFRRDALPAWCRKRVHVVRNTPELVDDGSPNYVKQDAVKIKLFFAGWIEKGRGIDSLFALAEDPRLDITVAGDGDPALVEKIKANLKIRYLGYLTHAQIMQETTECHFVYALYDPVREINIYAAPNKLAEALSCGKPVVMNDEVMLAKAVADYGCGVLMPYSQVSEVADQLSAILKDSEQYEKMCQGARLLFDSSYSWDVAKGEILKIYKSVTD